MTNEEAIYILSNNYSLCPEYCDCDCARCVVEAYRVATEAIEKLIKYQWHDLRKNPEDLPEEGKDVITCYFYEKRHKFYYEVDTLYWGQWKQSVDYDMDYWKVIAWKYIDPFEEDEDGQD